MAAEITSTGHGATMVLTIRNPEQRNALSPEIYPAAVEALSVAETVPEVRSVVITGAGDHFCAGGQLKRLLAAVDGGLEQQAEHVQGLHDWIEAIRTFPKPVIMAVEGAAAGGGLSLALAGDFLVAADNAVFEMSHVRIALSCDGGGAWHLARSLPRQVVSEILLAGDRISAQRLRELGVVNQVTPPGEALAQALALADRINGLAPNALASIKDLMNEAPARTLTEHLAAERDSLIRNLAHPNAKAGIQAFLDHTTARYS